jgi:DNA-binding GntR family transcriptional regulator
MNKIDFPVTSSLARTLSERIAMTLSERITDGTYGPAARLTEAMLAEEFGVSHGPVRDALRMLERAGLVTIMPYRGAQVTEITVQEVKELYQVRAALVGLRARWIAEDPQRATFVAQVEGMVARLEELAAAPDKGDEYFATARELNSTFTENVSNRWLRSMLQGLTLQTVRYTRIGLAAPERRRESARFWRGLLDAIKAGDATLAEKLASDNSLALRDAAIRHLQAQATASGQHVDAAQDAPFNSTTLPSGSAI